MSEISKSDVDAIKAMAKLNCVVAILDSTPQVGVWAERINALSNLAAEISDELDEYNHRQWNANDD